jgi:phage-related protein
LVTGLELASFRGALSADSLMSCRLEIKAGSDYSSFTMRSKSGRSVKPERPKRVHFVGTSNKDLRALPKSARAIFGYAILLAENGLKHPDAKPLKGFGGAGVLEVVEELDGDAYRAVYTVKFGDVVYVLHAFKKKSKVGSKTPPRDMELIKRLKEAEEHYRQSQASKKGSR